MSRPSPPPPRRSGPTRPGPAESIRSTPPGRPPAADAADAGPRVVRLNKFIAESGLCSRREADGLIAAGRVAVNGRPAVVGTAVGPDDRVAVDGVAVGATAPEAAVYIAYHKPVGVVSVTDERVAGNIVAAVGHPRRVFPVGRLDKDSEGLIFLTSDGDVVNKILRAGNAHEKEYEVTVDRPIGPEFVRRMAGGVPILGTTTLPCRVRQTGKCRFDIVLVQGLNRQIRRMCEFLGYEVRRLRRVRIMNVGLGHLPVGAWRDLTPAELAELRRLVASSSKTEEASRTPTPDGRNGAGADRGPGQGVRSAAADLPELD